MAPIPHIPPLSRFNRRLVFVAMFFLFLGAVPTLILYAVGYRLDLDNADQGPNLRTVGGMYITAEAEGVDMFINDQPIVDIRRFQRASYIQNLNEGKHTIHVQGVGLHTWVKDLPVFSHLVTEGRSFNLPVKPQVRLITPQLDTVSGLGILPAASSTIAVFAKAEVINSLLPPADIVGPQRFIDNSEYDYVESLFASSTIDLYERNRQTTLLERFTFERDAEAPEATTTPLRQVGQILLQPDGEEIYAHWLGEERGRPYYYCLQYNGQATAELYGEHVLASLLASRSDDFDWDNPELFGRFLCRDKIRLDRMGQEILWFDFLPGSRDLVLLHLTDGLYVVEIDDRAWQNTQLLYGGDSLTVLVDGQQILIKDGSYYLEVFTEIAS